MNCVSTFVSANVSYFVVKLLKTKLKRKELRGRFVELIMGHLNIIHEEAVGLIRVNANAQYNKVNADKVIVQENVTVRMFGTVNTIVIQKGAKLYFHGLIKGNVENNGGEIFIH